MEAPKPAAREPNEIRPHRHRLRAGRLCRRDPRGAARAEDGGRRARASRRHLPQLGMHSDQGAAALGRSLSISCATPRDSVSPPTMCGSTPRRSSSARATSPGALNRGVEGLLKKNEVAVIWGEARLPAPGRHHSFRAATRSPDRLARPAAGALGAGDYSADHIIIATGARPRGFPGLEPDGESDMDLFRGDDSGAHSGDLACRRLGRHRRRVRVLLQRDRIQSRCGRDAAPDLAGGGRGNRQIARAQFEGRGIAIRTSASVAKTILAADGRLVATIEGGARRRTSTLTRSSSPPASGRIPRTLASKNWASRWIAAASRSTVTVGQTCRGSVRDWRCRRSPDARA